MTTLRSGAVLLNSDLKLEQIFNEDAGLASDSVTSSFRDREGGLWLTQVSGVTRVHARAPVTSFDERSGLVGLVTAIARHEGAIYAGTTAGLFRLVPEGPGEPAEFQAAGGIVEAVHSLLSTGEGLLVATDGGISSLEGKKARPIYKGKPVYDLSRSKTDPAVVFAGGVDGLLLLRFAASAMGARRRRSGSGSGADQDRG